MQFLAGNTNQAVWLDRMAQEFHFGNTLPLLRLLLTVYLKLSAGTPSVALLQPVRNALNTTSTWCSVSTTYMLFHDQAPSMVHQVALPWVAVGATSQYAC
jgi:hypothetical protein